MAISIGPLLSELSASSETSPVDRFLPFVLLAFAILVVVAVIFAMKNLGSPGEDDDRRDTDD